MEREKIMNIIKTGAVIFLILASISLYAENISEESCSLNSKKLYGKVQFVDSFPDFKVQVVESFPDLKVQIVDSFPDSCGKWKIVDSFPDLKIKIVDSFPDFTIKFVDAFPGIP